MNINSSWYAHNTKEYIQRIEFHFDGEDIPNLYRELILDPDSCFVDEISFPKYENVDLAILEVSSRYAKCFDTYWLHSTCIRKKNFDGFINHTLTDEELRSDLIKISSYFKNVLIVCNIALSNDLDAFDSKRVEFNNTLKTICEDLENIDVFDPNILITLDDPARLIKDRNHFRDECLGTEIADEYYKIITGLKKM